MKSTMTLPTSPIYTTPLPLRERSERFGGDGRAQGAARARPRGGSPLLLPGGGGGAPASWSPPGVPGDRTETRDQQAFRGLLRNVLDAERCLEAVPHPFVRSAGRKDGDSPQRVPDPKPSRLLRGAARQRKEFHRQDRKPAARCSAACAGQDHASATPQPTMTCLVHWSDSVQGAAQHEEIVRASHISPGDPSRQAMRLRRERRGGTSVWDPSPLRGPTTRGPQARAAQAPSKTDVIRTD